MRGNLPAPESAAPQTTQSIRLHRAVTIQNPCFMGCHLATTQGPIANRNADPSTAREVNADPVPKLDIPRGAAVFLNLHHHAGPIGACDFAH